MKRLLPVLLVVLFVLLRSALVDEPQKQARRVERGMQIDALQHNMMRGPLSGTIIGF